MLISSHVPAGALIGGVLRKPTVAFAAGFASHLAMDAMPHWGLGPRGNWLPVARRDGMTGLATMAALAIAAPTDRRLAVVAGMTGACLPDTDKLGWYFTGKSPWPRRFDRFHQQIQREAPHRLHQEMATAAALFVVAGALLRRGRA
jgi:hypothetical protein